uniref:DUF7736 domain-containing protein n=1 Tax=viral metagenome TaxID=1070528 RepID=A0A6M3KYB8_9ZZZZ
MTREEAIAKHDSRWWESATAKEIVDVQLYEEFLCCPFGVFHKAMGEALGRPVYTHEFADQKALQEEYEGRREYDGILGSLERVAPGKPVIIVPAGGK